MSRRFTYMHGGSEEGGDASAAAAVCDAEEGVRK